MMTALAFLPLRQQGEVSASSPTEGSGVVPSQTHDPSVRYADTSPRCRAGRKR